jgi:hypothetical protein
MIFVLLSLRFKEIGTIHKQFKKHLVFINKSVKRLIYNWPSYIYYLLILKLFVVCVWCGVIDAKSNIL